MSSNLDRKRTDLDGGPVNVRSVVEPDRSAFIPIEFPRDEGAHPGQPVEWWYLNSQFSDAAGRKYAFMFAVLRDGRHWGAFLDKTADVFVPWGYQQPVTAATNALDLSSAAVGWKQADAPGFYRFAFRPAGMALEVTLKANKPPLLPGGGLIGVGQSGTSYYYILTDLALTGTLEQGTNLVAVSGKAWMDHQWGSWSWQSDFSQWKWFSVKLDNGVDLMLFNFYQGDALIRSYCGYMDADNRQYHKLTCRLVTRQYYTEPSGAKWQKVVNLEIPTLAGTRLTLTSERDLQFIEPSVLWEGSMKVTGTFKGVPVTGNAYGELNCPDY